MDGSAEHTQLPTDEEQTVTEEDTKAKEEINPFVGLVIYDRHGKGSENVAELQLNVQKKLNFYDDGSRVCERAVVIKFGYVKMYCG